MNKFEVVSKYLDCGIQVPERATLGSAGYDLAAAATTIIPSYHKLINKFPYIEDSSIGLSELEKITKENGIKPTLVPTGLKCKLDTDSYLKLVPRSSTPLKYWLVMANSEGIIDSDYYNNPKNEGLIYLQFINLSPYDIMVNKGDKLAQGIICKYGTTADDFVDTERTGGFGSTS